MKPLLALLAAFFIIGAAPTPYPEYGASALQIKVDRSFSSIPINTKYSKVRNRLRRADRDCRHASACDWRDEAGVRHIFETFENSNIMQMEVLVKRVVIREFGARPIRALGIGTARRKADVFASIASFDSQIVFDCSPPSISGDIGHHGCRAETGPGWVEIGFDENDQLTEARFHGYFV